MRRRVVSAGLVLCTVALVAAAASVGAVGGVGSTAERGALTVDDPVAYEGFDASVTEAAVAELADEVRADAGLTPLENAAVTHEFSREHSVDMAAREYMGHVTPDGDDLTDRVRSSPVASACKTVGENVARVYLDQPFEAGEEVYDTSDERVIAEALLTAWLDSPEHRANLLDEKWAGQSVGISVDADGVVYATHTFCER